MPHLAFQPDSLSDHPILPITACESAYYLRIQAKDHPGVLAQVATILSERGINIESIMQKEAEVQDGLVPVILVTHRVVGSALTTPSLRSSGSMTSWTRSYASASNS